MAAAEKLSYGARFGNEIGGKVAAVRDAMAPAKPGAPAAPAAQASAAPSKGRHTDWFTDGKGFGQEQKAPAQQSRYVKITPNMALKELAAATKNNMEVLGEDTYNEIASRMRKMMPNHRMLRSIKASILMEAPHLGSCRIGKVQIKEDQETGVVTELQYYIANFNTVIDTSNPTKLHTPQGVEFGRTFFGVVVDIDVANPDPELRGKAIGFNKAYGKEGVVFQTTVAKDALMFMTAFSSGKKPSDIAEMMEKASGQVAPSAPGMRR